MVMNGEILSKHSLDRQLGTHIHTVARKYFIIELISHFGSFSSTCVVLRHSVWAFQLYVHTYFMHTCHVMFLLRFNMQYV